MTQDRNELADYQLIRGLERAFDDGIPYLLRASDVAGVLSAFRSQPPAEGARMRVAVSNTWGAVESPLRNPNRQLSATRSTRLHNVRLGSRRRPVPAMA